MGALEMMNQITTEKTEKCDKPSKSKSQHGVDNRAPDQKLPPVKEIKPNKYGGKGCVETFIRQFEVVSKHNRWSKSEMADQLMCSLIDERTSDMEFWYN